MYYIPEQKFAVTPLKGISLVVKRIHFVRVIWLNISKYIYSICYEMFLRIIVQNIVIL